MQLFVPALGLLGLLGLAAAQNLATALQDYPQASQFSAFIADVAPELNTTAGRAFTILVPSNAAFAAFASARGTSFADLPADQRRTYLRYHVLAGALTSANFSAPAGITVPTLLREQQYNNRTAGAALVNKFGAQQAEGQVLYISSDINAVSSGRSGSGKRRFLVRQTQQGGLGVRSGLDRNTTLSAVDGVWGGGRFQIISTLLEPPAACSRTIRSIPELLNYDSALNRTQFWPQVDRTPNVTCLAPNNLALTRAGSPQTNLSQADLRAAIELHTLSGPLYSDLLGDGQVFRSFNGLSVRVTSNSSGIWFNDAKVVQQNVLTNNGLVHILDKYMSPLAGERLPVNGSTGTSTGGGSTASARPNAAAGSFAMLQQQAVIAILLAGIIVILM